MRARLRHIATSGCLIVGLVLPSSAGLAMPPGGGGGGGGSPGRPAASPEQVAAKRYEEAQRAREQALAYEEEARVSDEKGFFGLGARPSEKARAQWGKAVAGYNAAIRGAPDQYDRAHGELCQALQKLGKHEKALTSADRALQRIPGYAPALACRGQAYLELSRLGEAREDYERLRKLDGALASQLLDGMKAWLARNGGDPADGLSPAEVEAFRKWVRERDEPASVEGSLSGVRNP